METIYRILGKRGRVTIPYELRVRHGFRANDLISFTSDGKTVTVRREKICDDCTPMDGRDAPPSPEALQGFLKSLPTEEKANALRFLLQSMTEESGRREVSHG